MMSSIGFVNRYSPRFDVRWIDCRLVESRLLRWLHRYDLPIAACLMAWVSFSLPSREGPDSAEALDILALAKFAIRCGAIIYFSVLLVYDEIQVARICRRDRIPLPTRLLRTWFLFAGWAGLSIFWSPLKSVSLGQWLGLMSLLLLAETYSRRLRPFLASPEDCSEATPRRTIEHNFAEGRWNVSKLSPFSCFALLNILLWGYSFAVLVVHLMNPSISGLDRDELLDQRSGFVHPTAAGAASSLGIVLGVVGLATVKRRRPLLLLAIVTHVALLLSATSRSALLAAVIAIVLAGGLIMPRRYLGWLSLMGGVAAFMYLVVDPGGELLESSLGQASSYIQRGQSSVQLQGLSGRLEMWEAVWREFNKSPIIGHGYFVTSSNGKLDVWYGPGNHEAHNLFLQVMVSTGLLGTGLFIAAIVPVLWKLGSVLLSIKSIETLDPESFLFAKAILIVIIWYAAWSQGCITFLGPIRPESVVFFVLLGVFVGQFSDDAMRCRLPREGGVPS